MDDACTTIPVNQLTDRFVVRREVREAARSANFGLMEQAKISLAVYDIISRIDMGTSCKGNVVVNQMQNDGRIGMQVVCMANNTKCQNLLPTFLRETAWMIDEIKVDETNPAGTRVTIVIWAN
jgi:hypothetical protein